MEYLYYLNISANAITLLWLLCALMTGHRACDRSTYICSNHIIHYTWPKISLWKLQLSLASCTCSQGLQPIDLFIYLLILILLYVCTSFQFSLWLMHGIVFKFCIYFHITVSFRMVTWQYLIVLISSNELRCFMMKWWINLKLLNCDQSIAKFCAVWINNYTFRVKSHIICCTIVIRCTIVLHVHDSLMIRICN